MREKLSIGLTAAKGVETRALGSKASGRIPARLYRNNRDEGLVAL